ncbi:hypothetical protein [Govanella unica]|uniref:Uncharacterized protein n=1 Tax=Govanella unica TaxID=2975056 RepID=A0A9X3TVN4_9PROT|nr:hypothetical protein [Govania unica]MDA5192860.1 hypothetical protein [Govania unica]
MESFDLDSYLRTIYTAIEQDNANLDSLIISASERVPLQYDDILNKALVHAVKQFKQPAVHLLLKHGACPNLTHEGTKLETSPTTHDEEKISELHKFLENSLLYFVISSPTKENVENELRQKIAQELIFYGAITDFGINTHFVDICTIAISNLAWESVTRLCRIGVLPYLYFAHLALCRIAPTPPEVMPAYLQAIHDMLTLFDENLGYLAPHIQDISPLLYLMQGRILNYKYNSQSEDITLLCDQITNFIERLTKRSSGQLGLFQKLIRHAIETGHLHELITLENKMDFYELMPFDIVCLSKNPPSLPVIIAWVQALLDCRHSENKKQLYWDLFKIMWRRCLPNEPLPKFLEHSAKDPT